MRGFFQADVTREAEIAASVQAAVSRFGRLDALFNNAGSGTKGGPDDFTQADFEQAMSLLVGSALYGIKHATPHMRAQGGGAIISNASIAAHRSHMAGYLYSIAKAAVVHASRMAAVQLGADRIRVKHHFARRHCDAIFMGGSNVAAGMETDKVQAQDGQAGGQSRESQRSAHLRLSRRHRVGRASTWPATKDGS